MPFTSHRFKRIDVYFTVLKPGKRISCCYTAAMIDPLFRGARLFCAAGLFSGEGQQPIPFQTFFLNGGTISSTGYRMNKFQQKIPGIFLCAFILLFFSSF